jgi:hypothetical protein
MDSGRDESLPGSRRACSMRRSDGIVIGDMRMMLRDGIWSSMRMELRMIPNVSRRMNRGWLRELRDERDADPVASFSPSLSLQTFNSGRQPQFTSTRSGIKVPPSPTTTTPPHLPPPRRSIPALLGSPPPPTPTNPPTAPQPQPSATP